MQQHRPDWVLNAAAYTAVDKAESEPELAYRINAEAPGLMAEEAKALGAALVTGKPQAFAVVPGPGLLNAGAALSTAYACNARVLCLTSTVNSALIDRRYGALHEINDQDGLLRSSVRLSTLAGEWLFHSAYPTTQADAVFFGPDTCRFVRAMEQTPAPARDPVRRIVDIGCGSGVAAITLARRFPQSEVLAVDINGRALALADVNIQLAGVGNAPFHPADFTIPNKRVSQPRLGHAFSVHGISGNIGWALSPLFLTFVAGRAGWRVALLAASCVAFAVLALLVLNRQALRPEPAAAPVAGKPGAAGASAFGFLKLKVVWLCFAFFLISAVALAGSTVTSQPAEARQRRMLRLAP